MELTTIVNPDVQYVSEFGDMLWSNEELQHPPYSPHLCLNRLDGNESNSQILNLTAITFNPFHAVRALDICTQFFDVVKFCDGYTKYQSYGVVPIAVLTDDKAKYRQILQKNYTPYLDLIFNDQWHRESYEGLLLPEVGRVGSIFLGTGYMSGFMSGDGFPELNLAKLKLSNGDWLYVTFWEWYNK